MITEIVSNSKPQSDAQFADKVAQKNVLGAWKMMLGCKYIK